MRLKKKPILDPIDLEHFGVYRAGLTSDEIDEYLVNRAKTCGKPSFRYKAKKELVRKFSKIAGVNTGAIAPDGTCLMYRWDVQRFADVLFLQKKTYWD